MPRRIARGGVIDRRTPAEIAAADGMTELFAEAAIVEERTLADIREAAARDDLTPADEDALIERYKAFRASRTRAAEVAAATERRVAKWIMRHGEPRTAAARQALGAHIAKPAVRDAEALSEAARQAIEHERREQAQAAAQAPPLPQVTRSPGRRPRTTEVSPGEPQAPRRQRQRRTRVGVVGTLSMFTSPYDEDDE